MITLVCVLRSGGLYDPSWVARLRRNVERFDRPQRFVCLSDMAVPCERILLQHNWPGWWSKIELFRPGLFQGRVLYLDLDCLITGSLAPLAAGEGFRIVKDWWQPGFNSSVMAWDAGDCALFNRFQPDVMGKLHGDQDWINLARPSAQTFDPSLVVSYKANCRQKGKAAQLPRNARVVAFHGRPKPADVKDEWVSDYWNS